MDIQDIWRFVVVMSAGIVILETLGWLVKRICLICGRFTITTDYADVPEEPDSTKWPLRDYRIVAPRLTATSPRDKRARSRD